MSASTTQTEKADVQPESFAFSEENMAKARAFIAKYPEGRQQSAVMPLLDLAQRQEGWVSLPAMNYIADMLGMEPIRVYEVATFYTMYQLKPVGKHHLEVCTNLPCMLRGAEDIVDVLKQELGVDVGETTADGLFTLSEAECLGACANAPMMQIGDFYYEDLDAESVRSIIQALRKGEQPKPGSQIGRTGSEPAGGLTSLCGGCGQKGEKS
ncbi:NADH-quinone oxidoreductase subunit NuoE [Telmatospirillum sp. J64-1]|uniref:NADH-quinone oxidoreductase subunit NuoE n=1 Tax=Telmatospirillum sp. J64-1 TaxID=2502183 RepID=UPI00115E4846|nr:NADH-quinone oxidoreductase subunit NuoE [Telmatospirillum sp. J64-1]